jgi:Arc/MetJ-type ribon-helix-helix transcriptional regulator
MMGLRRCPMTRIVTVSVDDDLVAFIDAQVASGR